MQNILINMFEKFYYDRLRNDRAFNRKSEESEEQVQERRS